VSAASEDLQNIFELTIRGYVESDAAAVAEVLAESPEAASWSLESLRRMESDGLDGWIAMRRDAVVGFLVGRAAADEFEILNFAVSTLHRRQGIASKLLEFVLETSRKQGSRQVFLEVRASNIAAIGLYQRHGFSECGRRIRYYSQPVEDAIVLSRPAVDCL